MRQLTPQSSLSYTGNANNMLPTCCICHETLGTNGGASTLPCGHNGCYGCLSEVRQKHGSCPLCREPFSQLAHNPELGNLVQLTASVFPEEHDDDGWTALPDKALAAQQYAIDLRRATPRPDIPSAPVAPHFQPHALAEDTRQLLDLSPPQWLPDSMARGCGFCAQPFRALTRLRHHCRCCGRIFCASCSSQRMLLPPRFNCRQPERVCDNCSMLLAPLQPYLAATMSAAAQQPVHDAVLDGVSLRSWLNLPYHTNLEPDVYKAANVLAKFTQAWRLKPETGIPRSVLGGASGLVVCSVIKVGAGWSASFGTGLVVSRGQNGRWSAPCAVAIAGLGWGLQVGGEITDLLLVLRTPQAVQACCGTVQMGVGGSVGMSLGSVGRTGHAALMVGTSALAHPGAVYAYSCSQGAFIGMALEGTVMTVRDSVNHAFYGMPVSARSLLVQRSVQPPPAAAALYDSLHALMRKFEVPEVAAKPAHAQLALPAPPQQQPALQPATTEAIPTARTALVSTASTAMSLYPSYPHAHENDQSHPDNESYSRSGNQAHSEQPHRQQLYTQQAPEAPGSKMSSGMPAAWIAPSYHAPSAHRSSAPSAPTLLTHSTSYEDDCSGYALFD